MKLTTNYALKKIELTDSPPDITVLNDNFDTIDGEMKSIRDEEKILIPQSGSTANAIVLSFTLTDKKRGSFRAASNNTGNMTINGKAFKKDAATHIPVNGVKSGKVYDFYYDQAADSVFILAKASGNAAPSEVLATKTFCNDDGEQTGAMVNQGPASSETVNLTSEGAEYTIAAGYHTGLRKIKAVISGLVASAIKAGTTVGGIAGTFTSDATATAAQILSGAIAYINGNKVTGTMPNNGPSSAETINLTSEGAEYTIPSGYHTGLRKIKAVISGLIASVIKTGVTVGGIAGTFTSDATATAAQILSGAIAYINGNKVTGTMTNRGAINQSLSINGSYTIPEGYHNGSGKVTQSITTKSAQTYNPSTSVQTITAGQYLSGVQTIAATTGTATVADVASGKTFNSASGIGLVGTRPWVKFTPGNNIQFTHPDGPIWANDISYVKKLAIKVGGAGTYRVSFDMYTNSPGKYAYGRIYVNGTAIGIERASTATTWTTYTEDISLNENDEIQIYSKSESGGSVNIKTFTIKTAEPTVFAKV